MEAVEGIISKADFARLLDVEPAAVSVWIARGKLSTPALTEDGRIAVEEALKQLRERVDPVRSSVDFGGEDAADSSSGNGTSLIARQRVQRLAEGELRLARLRREELEQRGLYVRAADVRRQWGRLSSQILAAFENFLLRDLPIELGLDHEQTMRMRVAWRAYRERQAETTGGADDGL
jgi:hypothetical protein